MTTRSYPTKVWRSTGDDAREVEAIAYATAIDQIATYDEGIRLWREANP